MKIKITDSTHPLFEQEVEGYCVYYDYQFTGSSPDIYLISTPNGNETILSTQIDVAYYQQQELAETIEELGANIGDTVLIIESGSGGHSASFSFDKLI